MNPFQFYLPTEVIFGDGRLKELDERIEKIHQNILIVSDENIATKTAIIDNIRSHLKGRQLTIFHEVEENPSFATLEKGRELARSQNIDLVIGLGGGSPMDAAKGIAVLATNDEPMTAYMSGQSLSHDPLPIVCIPTTSGTGSEVTPYAVFTDPEGKNKGGFAHPKIFPTFSILDPEVTYSMPESVVVNTGLDALTHSIEAYLSLDAFPMSDMFALESIKTILNELPKAAEKDPKAMGQMAYASMLAGVAITHGGTILLHIMGYPLTVFHAIPHGKANAILLPEFMRFMREKSTDHVQAKVQVLDFMFEKFGGIDHFVQSLGISTALSSHGIREDEIDTFAEKVIVKGDVKITPARLTKEIIADIFRRAM